MPGGREVIVRGPLWVAMMAARAAVLLHVLPMSAAVRPLGGSSAPLPCCQGMAHSLKVDQAGEQPAQGRHLHAAHELLGAASSAGAPLACRRQTEDRSGHDAEAGA